MATTNTSQMTTVTIASTKETTNGNVVTVRLTLYICTVYADFLVCVRKCASTKLKVYGRDAYSIYVERLQSLITEPAHFGKSKAFSESRPWARRPDHVCPNRCNTFREEFFETSQCHNRPREKNAQNRITLIKLTQY